MTKIPTAEEQFKMYSNLYQFEEGPSEYLVDKEDFVTAVIEFAKLHRKAILEVALKEVDFNWDGDELVFNTHGLIIDKNSILNAYPESLIV